MLAPRSHEAASHGGTTGVAPTAYTSLPLASRRTSSCEPAAARRPSGEGGADWIPDWASLRETFAEQLPSALRKLLADNAANVAGRQRLRGERLRRLQKQKAKDEV